MYEPDSQDSSQQVSAKIDEIILGLKWMFVLLIVLISIPNIQIALSISWFAKGFAEALPGMMLPLVTSTLITLPTFFCLLAFVWPILGLLNLFYSKRLQFWMIGSVIILFMIGLQLDLTYMGCFTPFFSGMVAPESSAK